MMFFINKYLYCINIIMEREPPIPLKKRKVEQELDITTLGVDPMSDMEMVRANLAAKAPEQAAMVKDSLPQEPLLKGEAATASDNAKAEIAEMAEMAAREEEEEEEEGTMETVEDSLIESIRSIFPNPAEQAAILQLIERTNIGKVEQEEGSNVSCLNNIIEIGVASINFASYFVQKLGTKVKAIFNRDEEKKIEFVLSETMPLSDLEKLRGAVETSLGETSDSELATDMGKLHKVLEGAIDRSPTSSRHGTPHGTPAQSQESEVSVRSEDSTFGRPNTVRCKPIVALADILGGIIVETYNTRGNNIQEITFQNIAIVRDKIQEYFTKVKDANKKAAARELLTRLNISDYQHAQRTREPSREEELIIVSFKDDLDFFDNQLNKLTYEIDCQRILLRESLIKLTKSLMDTLKLNHKYRQFKKLIDVFLEQTTAEDRNRIIEQITILCNETLPTDGYATGSTVRTLFKTTPIEGLINTINNKEITKEQQEADLIAFKQEINTKLRNIMDSTAGGSTKKHKKKTHKKRKTHKRKSNKKRRTKRRR